MRLPDNPWRETADAATRMQNPDGYWCVRDDDRVLYFWHELTVGRDRRPRRVPRLLRQRRLRMKGAHHFARDVDRHQNPLRPKGRSRYRSA